MDPRNIGAIFIVLLLMVVAVFGFFSIVGEGDITNVYEKYFPVVNASVNQSLYVIAQLENVVVEQVLSNGTIVYVDPTYWDYALLYIEVNHTVLI